VQLAADLEEKDNLAPLPANLAAKIAGKAAAGPAAASHKAAEETAIEDTVTPTDSLNSRMTADWCAITAHDPGRHHRIPPSHGGSASAASRPAHPPTHTPHVHPSLHNRYAMMALVGNPHLQAASLMQMVAAPALSPAAPLLGSAVAADDANAAAAAATAANAAAAAAAPAAPSLAGRAAGSGGALPSLPPVPTAATATATATGAAAAAAAASPAAHPPSTLAHALRLLAGGPPAPARSNEAAANTLAARTLLMLAFAADLVLAMIEWLLAAMNTVPLLTLFASSTTTTAANTTSTSSTSTSTSTSSTSTSSLASASPFPPQDTISRANRFHRRCHQHAHTMQELRDAVAEKKERDAAAAAHAAAVGANRENFWAVSGDGDMAAKPAPTPDAGREDGLDEDGYLVVDERKNARCRPRA